MKIFYAIQGTGNGHVSRAVQLYPYLKKYGDVDFFLSGSNAQLNLDIPIKYQSKGVSLFYKPTGGLDYKKIAKSLSLSVLNEAKQLPLNQYDLIINDFEFISFSFIKFIL
jgi:UDP-N-acetylglucosamine:LPS N-acetylglucosamine transferase